MSARVCLFIAPIASAIALAGLPARAANPPADICAELVAWLDESQKPPPGDPAKPAPPATAAKPEPEAKDLKTAVERPAAQDPSRAGGQDQAQTSSGITAPVTPGGPGATGPQGQAQEQSRSGAANAPGDERGASRPAAPAPPPPAAQAKAPPPSPKAMELARASAAGRDTKGCKAAVREMRLAGVALPAPLIALGALKDAGPSGNPPPPPAPVAPKPPAPETGAPK